MIEFLKVTKRYKRKTVLDDITFNIEHGEFVIITGQSGAGKTTLIHALIGAEHLSKGKIIVDNFDVTKSKPDDLQDYRREIGVVFQDYKLLPRKTVFENIAFALEVCGYPKKYVNERTVELMALTNIEDIRNHYPSQISGGEKQRTAIARALVHKPKILIADEPTGNLDEENAEKVIKLLLKIHKSGKTVILSSHNNEIMRMIKDARIVRIEHGRIKKSR